jgi:hypothetical protein
MLFFLIATVLFAAAEFVMGWWALPVVGVILGLVGARRKMVGVTVASAALTAWACLYGWSAMQGNFPAFLSQLASSMQLKPFQLVSAALGLPALLAGPASALGAGVMSLIRRGEGAAA